VSAKNCLFFLILLLMVSCASKEVSVSTEEAPELDKKLNTKMGDRRDQVGVRDNTVKVQKTLYLEEEMSKLQGEIGDLENLIYGQSKSHPNGLFLQLKTCRQKSADPRVGGNGTPAPMEKWEKISEKDEDFSYHVDRDDNVVAVSEENLSTRITNLKKLKRVLSDKYDAFKEKSDACEASYRTALVNHGLNPNDTESAGEWVEGPNGFKVWKMRKGKTNDPEELMRRKQEREKSQKSE